MASDDPLPLQRANQAYYQAMVAERRRIVVPLVIFVCIFYFALPVLTNFSSTLDDEVFSGVTWAYLYAFAQFVMVVIVTTYYRRRMDAAEERLRPAGLDETAAHYDDYSTWEHHEEELEELEDEYDMLEKRELEKRHDGEREERQ